MREQQTVLPLRANAAARYDSWPRGEAQETFVEASQGLRLVNSGAMSEDPGTVHTPCGGGCRGKRGADTWLREQGVDTLLVCVCALDGHKVQMLPPAHDKSNRRVVYPPAHRARQQSAALASAAVWINAIILLFSPPQPCRLDSPSALPP
ncbi:unnamed protein product [Closterium sp. Yama58-4]|nr:unnamed protein product [Closterium sp. Yama58-4]